MCLFVLIYLIIYKTSKYFVFYFFYKNCIVMSFDMNWDIDIYKEEHESEDHWQLRRKFMQKWKSDYSEERLVCLARVFANMEFLGCRYPTEVMQEVAGLSHELAQDYRNSRKNMLQRTFVSASAAAEDRAKGIKREGGIVIDTPPKKSAKISFVKSGEKIDSEEELPVDIDENIQDDNTDNEAIIQNERRNADLLGLNEYLEEMNKIKCINLRSFKESMFHTLFGRMVLLIRPWTGKLGNIQASCQACAIQLQSSYENGAFSLSLNGKLLSRATGATKPEAKSIVELMAWNRLKEEAVSVVVKEQWIAHGDARINVSDVSTKRDDIFGTPVENTVATKMMKMMGWKGGGLGADAQGIAEPIKPNMQLVNRAGLGSSTSDIRQLRRAAQSLMQRYIASDTLDLDLVFSSDFTKDERAALHQCAQRQGLASKSYGKGDKDRFLVVKKKLDPFSLVRAVIEKGGITPKYQVFIPASLR